MRFTSVLLGAFAAIASAQSTSGTPTTVSAPTTAATDPQSSAQAEMLKCIEACPAGDVNCTSKCIAVPNPSASQVSATNQCIANCNPGNGTAADSLNYQNCRDGCIASFYYSASGGTPATTNVPSGSGSGSGSTASTTGAAPSGSGATTGSAASQTGSNTASASNAAQTSKNAAPAGYAVGGSAMGVLGFVAAILAL